MSLDRFGSLSGDHTEFIAKGLVDPDPEVRGSAAANLGAVRRAKAWPHLVRAARSELSDEVQRHISLAFEGYREEIILDLLLELLAQRDRDYRLRMNAVMQLWKYEPTIVVPRLIEVMLGDEHALVRLHAASSLELLDELCPFDASLRQLWLRLAEEDQAGVAKLATTVLNRTSVHTSADILVLITRRLNHPEPDERSIALHRLSMLAPTSATAIAEPLLEDQHPGVRMACCSCLGAVRDDTGIPLLLTALRADPESRVQSAALQGLENYHTTEIGEILLDMLDAEALAGDALSTLCRQLWKYPSTRTIELLQRVLQSSVKLPHRLFVESTLAFLQRFASADPGSPA